MKISRMTALASLVVGLGAGLTGCHASVHVGAEAKTAKAEAPTDGDGDGIADRDDKCAGEKEDGLAPSATDGCANPDADGDKIAAAADKCPKEPETANGFEDGDGCPDEAPKAKLGILPITKFKLVKLTEKTVDISEKIQFGKDSAEIQPTSAALLDEIAGVLKENPEVQLVEIGGHASQEGSAKRNLDLTQLRTEAVVKELVARGVPRERLIPQGFGAHCPTNPAKDAQALEQNRRVEFKILYRAGKSVEVPRGCDAAAKAGIKLVVPPAPVWNPPAAAPAAAAPTMAPAVVNPAPAHAGH